MALCRLFCSCGPHRQCSPDAPSGADNGLSAEPGQLLLPAAGSHAGGLQCCPGFADGHAAGASCRSCWAPAWAAAGATTWAPTRAAPPPAAAGSSAPAAHDGLHVDALSGGLLSVSSRHCLKGCKFMPFQGCTGLLSARVSASRLAHRSQIECCQAGRLLPACSCGCCSHSKSRCTELLCPHASSCKLAERSQILHLLLPFSGPSSSSCS